MTVNGTPASTKIDDELAKAKAAIDADRKEETALKANKKKLDAELERLKAKSAAAWTIEAKVAEIALAEGKVLDAQQATQKALDAHARLLAEARDPDSNKIAMTVQLEVLPPVPDPDHWYLATLDAGRFRDDVWDLDTNELGLLSNGANTSTDRLADILVDLAGFAGVVSPPTLHSVGPYQQMPDRTDPDRDPCKLGSRFSWQYDFDPYDTQSRVNQELHRCRLPFQVKVDVPAGSILRYEFADPEASTAIDATPAVGDSPPQATVAAIDKPVFVTNPLSDDTNGIPLSQDRGHTNQIERAAFRNATLPGEAVDGLVYRRPIPIGIAVLATTPEGDATIRSTVVMLPQGGLIATIPYQAEPLVASVTNTTFVDGQPTKWHSEKPSEVAAAFRIPVAMAKALVSIPAELIKLRVDYSSSEVELVKAQTAYLCALEALQKAEGTAPPGFCPPAEASDSE